MENSSGKGGEITDDTSVGSISSTTSALKNGGSKKHTRRNSFSQGPIGSARMKKKRVSFKHPIEEPEPEHLSSPMYDETSPYYEEGTSTYDENEVEKRRAARQRRRRSRDVGDNDALCACCIS
jgi:hypothetical protein